MEYGSGYVLTCDCCLGLLSLSCVYYSPLFLSSSLLSSLLLACFVLVPYLSSLRFFLFWSCHLLGVEGKFITLSPLFPSLSSNPSRVRVRGRVGSCIVCDSCHECGRTTHPSLLYKLDPTTTVPT